MVWALELAEKLVCQLARRSWSQTYGLEAVWCHCASCISIYWNSDIFKFVLGGWSNMDRVITWRSKVFCAALVMMWQGLEGLIHILVSDTALWWSSAGVTIFLWSNSSIILGQNLRRANMEKLPCDCIAIGLQQPLFLRTKSKLERI